MGALVAEFVKVLVLGHVVLSMDVQGRVEPLVLTNQGLVKGIKSTEGDFSSFLGVPYAQINSSNPFGDSLPALVYEDVFQAYDGSIACPQTYNSNDGEMGTLDCLRLNIYVPNAANSNNPLPVLVWIHGGLYNLGKAGDYEPHTLVRHGIVLVTVNYRLGPYGFMCLNIPTAPSNQGLRDQLSALRWIKQNIARFGGNPYKITLAGESAGSGSVNLHLYSPNEKLFHQAIMQSGIAATHVVQADESGAIKVAEHLGYNAPNTESALEFLTNTSSELVTAATAELNILFGPCVEKPIEGIESIVPANPYLATFPRKTKNVPVIIGVTSKERYGGVNAKFTSFKDILKSRFDFDDNELEKVSEIVKHYYAGDVLDSINSSDLEDFEGDISDNYATERELTKLFEQGAGAVYNYVYEYVGENDAGDRDSRSAPHMAELKYLFSNGNFNEEEQQVADLISSLWANFTKQGNPTHASSTVTWPAETADERPYFVIGTEPRVEHRYRHAALAFWDLFYEKYGNSAKILKHGYYSTPIKRHLKNLIG